MSFRVLIVPVEPTNDRYIQKPLIETLLGVIGKPNARVEVLSNPRITGYADAKRLLHERVLEQYADRDLLLFLPDGDLRNRRAEFQTLEAEARKRGARLVCCAAVPEVEAWLLAGHVEKLELGWSEVRSHATLKESVFERFLTLHGDARRAGGGRDLLMRTTLSNYSGLLSRCKELAELEARLRAILAS